MSSHTGQRAVGQGYGEDISMVVVHFEVEFATSGIETCFLFFFYPAIGNKIPAAEMTPFDHAHPLQGFA
jgi:hypothetical protein